MKCATVLVVFPLELPTANRREHRMVLSGRVAQQRWMTRRYLELTGPPPALPCVITLTRIGPRLCDSDRACASLAAVRDEVARWMHGVPERDAHGKVPRAPDGQQDGIAWCYAQERGRAHGVRIEVKAA